MALTAIDINTLPVLLAGPMVRRLTRTQVSVWAALCDPSQVTLHVQRADGTGSEVTTTATPKQIGRHLWVVLLTANGVDSGQFLPGQLYAYSLSAAGWPANRAPTWSAFALTGQTHPTFLGLPTDLGQFRVLHTSCRRPHSDRRDGLAHGLALLEDSAQRPCLLIMSGDQVYADQVSPAFMALIWRIDDARQINDARLVDIDENVLFGPRPLLNERRDKNEEFKLTNATGNHLWTLAEFYAHYLLSWSNVLWPQEPPAFEDYVDEMHHPDDFDAEKAQEAWDIEVKNMKLFLDALPNVRKVLANVPSLMMHDDHEATDDWNLNYRWVCGVYSTLGGSRIIANGLLSYVIFQHWGNVPPPFQTAGTPERLVLDGAAWAGTASGSSAHPSKSPQSTLLQRLPVPTTAETAPTGSAATIPLPPLPPGGFALRDLAVGDSVRYDFRLGPAEGYPLHLVFLDEHTARLIPGEDTPVGRVAPDALDLMWPPPTGTQANVPTLLVAPVPVLSQYFVEQQLRSLLALGPAGEEEADVEDWTLWRPVYEHLLLRIGEWRRVIILSGDVHFGDTQTLTYRRPHDTTSSARAVQFVTSAAKTSDLKHMVLHLFGDSMTQMGLVRTREFYGYESLSEAQQEALQGLPPAHSSLIYDDLIDVLLGRILRRAHEIPAVFSAEVATVYGLGDPDWRYTIAQIDEEPVTWPALVAAMSDPAWADLAWPGWDPDASLATVRALHAANLHRIGRVLTALPQIARISVATAGTLRARQETFMLSGSSASDPIICMVTEGDLG